MHYSLVSSVIAGCITSVYADPTISTFPSSLTLSASYDPIKAAYWTGLPHHRRTPFCVSPDGTKAFLAYLDSTYKNIQVQQVDVSTFASVGTAVSIAGYEASGLVCHNNGFALMATVDASSATVALTGYPTDEAPIVSIIRYTNGIRTWATPVNGPGINVSDGQTATPDANGDLTYSEASGMYGAYFVVTAYSGTSSGHYGDSIQYVDSNGKRTDITGASSSFGCSHNTGIAIEAADAPPFATVCAEDQGAIWLNTDTQYMSGIKIANENTTNGVSGEPMGGMGGSYSNLALFPDTTKYVFAWQSRGSSMMGTNAWLGSPYTATTEPRWLNHNVAIATLSSKNKLKGVEASSTVGGPGDAQVNWITESSTEDHQNVRVGTLSSDLALVSWETLINPDCQPVPLSCSGIYAGTSYQFIDSAGSKIGSPVVSTTTFVSGDFATIGSQICWPYVDMDWDLSTAKETGVLQTKMSFACAGQGPSSSASSTANAPVSTTSSATSRSTVAPALDVAQVVKANVDFSSVVPSVTTSGGPFATSPVTPSATSSASVIKAIPSSITSIASSAPPVLADTCALACLVAYDNCRGEADSNKATCASRYTICLGYSPYDSTGSLVTPTACSTTAAATLVSSSAPSLAPYVNSTSSWSITAFSTGYGAGTGAVPRPTTLVTKSAKSKKNKSSKTKEKTKKSKTSRTKMVKSAKTRGGTIVDTGILSVTDYEIATQGIYTTIYPVAETTPAVESAPDSTTALSTASSTAGPTSTTSTERAYSAPTASAGPVIDLVPLVNSEAETPNTDTTSPSNTTTTSPSVTMPVGTTLSDLLHWLAEKLEELLASKSA